MPQTHKLCVPECFADGAPTEELAAQIEQSLSCVCDVIFQLGILRIPAPREHQSHVRAHIRLAHTAAVGFLSIDLSKDAALLLTRRFEVPANTPEWETFTQDVTCEMANIVGNNLRTYFHSKGDVKFGIGLAMPGEMPANVRGILRMEFLLGPTASAVVAFSAHDDLPMTASQAEMG